MRLPHSVLRRLPPPCMSSTQSPAARVLKRRASTNLAHSEAPRKQSRTDFGFGLTDEDRVQPPRAPRQDNGGRRGRAPSLRQIMENSLLDEQPKQKNRPPIRVEVPKVSMRAQRKNASLSELPGPLHDAAHIHATFSTAALNRPDPDALQNPKATISNWVSKMDVDYEPTFQKGRVGHQVVTRHVAVSLSSSFILNIPKSNYSNRSRVID